MCEETPLREVLFEIASIPGRGRGAVAPTRFRAGAVVSSTFPVAHVVHPNVARGRCSLCFSTGLGDGSGVKQCGRCKAVAYCCKDHQMEDWAGMCSWLDPKVDGEPQRLGVLGSQRTVTWLWSSLCLQCSSTTLFTMCTPACTWVCCLRT
jgi:hypothetical protein